MNAVEIIDVTKSFGSTVAANKINLSVRKGEFYSFLGPSGCGKTTVLRMIAGFEKPTSGRILIDGKDIVSMPAHKRPVNMVFQNYALFPHLTILDNVCFGLKFGAHSKAEIVERAKKAISLVRLEHLQGRFPSQLSGGQQQRIALARAIVKEPSVLLLDEPLSALDPQIREEMQSELSRLQSELNMTFIMVTHDQDEALALSHRIAVFCQGHLDQVGSPQAIYDEPATEFVARFIGQTNIFAGTVESFSSGQAKIKISDGTVCGAPSNPVEPGATVMICIKPEQTSVVSVGSQPSLNVCHDGLLSLPGVVKSVSYKGDTTDCLVQTKVGTFRAEIPRQHQAVPLGAHVSVQFNCSDLRVIVKSDGPKALSAAAN